MFAMKAATKKAEVCIVIRRQHGLAASELLVIIAIIVALVIVLISAISKKINNEQPTTNSFDTITNNDKNSTKWVWNNKVRTNCFDGFEYYIKGADDNILAPVFDLNTGTPKQCSAEQFKSKQTCILYGYDEVRGVLNRVRVDKDGMIIDDLRKFKKLGVGTINYDSDFQNIGVLVEFER